MPIDIVMALITGLAESAPLLLEAAVQLLMSIIEAIPIIIEQLLAVLPELITTICNFLAENIPLIVPGSYRCDDLRKVFSYGHHNIRDRFNDTH